MSRLRSAQAKAIRRAYLVQGVIALAVYSAVFALACATVLPALYQKAGYVYADLVAPWSYVSQDDYERLQQQTDAARQQAGDGQGAGEEVSAAADLGFWTDGTFFAVRDLSSYHAFMDAGGEAATALYLSGVAVACIVFASRILRRLDELSCAVTTLFADRFAPVNLPDALAETRAELVQIQNRALSDERAAKAAEVRKNELVAYLAHDIRTPLTSVIGYLSILSESPELPAAERAKLAGIALDKAERLEVLVGEFFEITRYDLQAIPIERERVGLSLFLEQVADELHPEAQAKRVEISVDAPQDATAFIDPEKMARAVSNVLKNAVAFADEGTAVSVTARIEDGRAVMRVADRGKEIAPAHLQAIFEKFFREDGARSSAKGGAGLGLAIAREIVEVHGGTIQAESALGETTFTICVPAEPAQPAQPA